MLLRDDIQHALTKATAPRRYADGGALFLSVKGRGRPAHWTYRTRYRGWPVEIVLGTATVKEADGKLTIKQARDMRDRLRIQVKDGEAALVVMGVPERKLLSAMRRAECVVDVEDLLFARPYCRAGLIDKSGGEPGRLGLARRILQTADRRLRGQWRAALWTAPNRNLHQWVMPQPVEVDGILVAARDRTDARHHHFEHRMPDAVRIAVIWHRFRKPPAHPELVLRLSQQQQTSIGRLVAALKISCELLASNRWKVEGKRSSVGHGGCGVALVHDAIRLNIDLLRESRLSRYQPPTNSQPRA